MKIRRSIIWFIGVGVILVALVLWYKKKQPLETLPAGSAATNVTPSATTVPSLPLYTNVQAAQVTATATSQSQSALPQDKVGLIKNILQGNDADIMFYGQLEDQSGSAISGAEINFSIQYEDANSRGIHRGQVLSDANGFFIISGYKGEDLGIMPQKVGYTLATTDTYFRYSQLQPGYFISDANNPTIIKMWKLQGSQPLVGINKTYKLPYTSAPIFFDLVAGKVVPIGGDLEIIVTRTSGSITQRNHGDWSIELVPVNGGIMESDYRAAQVTFDAPVDGYQSSYLVQMNHDDPAWFNNIQKELFLTSRNGQVYSKLSLDFGINKEPNGLMWLQFKGVANPNGSRNWEASAPQ
jgi:hypothetical protein